MIKKRCFGDGSLCYERYHDTEWGVPSHDDRYLFEMLLLEGAQAGLSWSVVLQKRQAYRRVFHNFDVSAVASMTDSALLGLLKEKGIIRNRLKIFSARQNARVFLRVQREKGSFASYVWEFVCHRPLLNHWKAWEEVPAESDVSKKLALDLRKRGMAFVGPKIMYAYMQAVGMVNDHLTSCSFR